MFFQIIKFVISDTFESENNANYSEIFSVINLSDNKGGCKANFLLAILNNINQCPRQQLGQLKQVPAMAGINIECLRHTQLD